MENLNEAHRGGTFCNAKAGLAIGSTASQVALAAPNGAGIDYCIGGIFYHKADSASVAITAAAVQPVLTKCLYLVCLNAAGTLSTVKGNAVLAADLTNGNAVLQWPKPAADTCVIGAFKVSLANAATFTAGTTALNATDVTTTYYDLFAIPSAPLLS